MHVEFSSVRTRIVGDLVLPGHGVPVPALIICHGAAEYKENYAEMAEYLRCRDIASLALDMHGHGESEGPRCHVTIERWVSNIKDAIEFLQEYPGVDPNRIAAFGMSSGGTAVLEGAASGLSLCSLVVLDATVKNPLKWWESLVLEILIFAGWLKRALTDDDLRLSLIKCLGELHLAADPEINKRIQMDYRFLCACNAFPLPGARQAFFVDTIKRVPRIQIPTLVLWGAEDALDPPSTGEELFADLVCNKKLMIIPGNGHAGHLDRNRQAVFEATAKWILRNYKHA